MGRSTRRPLRNVPFDEPRSSTISTPAVRTIRACRLGRPGSPRRGRTPLPPDDHLGAVKDQLRDLHPPFQAAGGKEPGGGDGDRAEEERVARRHRGPDDPRGGRIDRGAVGRAQVLDHPLGPSGCDRDPGVPGRDLDVVDHEVVAGVATDAYDSEEGFRRGGRRSLPVVLLLRPGHRHGEAERHLIAAADRGGRAADLRPLT